MSSAPSLVDSAVEKRSHNIDYHSCLLKGLVGGLGCIPSQCGSHPFDVIKIRMQTRGETLGNAIRGISASMASVRGKPSMTHALAPFYRGFLPAAEQRMVTRTPMFLFSELFTQMVYNNTDWSKTVAVFVGSVGSGFTTGTLAGIAEYRKKLLSQGIMEAKEVRWMKLYMVAKKHGTLPWIWRRMLAAGICAASYDSIFFGTEHYISGILGYSPAVSYSVAAAAAVACSFSFDSVVARMMIVPPQLPCKSFSESWIDLFRADPANGVVGLRRIMVANKGISARGIEFFLSYGITGLTSVYIVSSFTALVGKPDQNVVDSLPH